MPELNGGDQAPRRFDSLSATPAPRSSFWLPFRSSFFEGGGICSGRHADNDTKIYTTRHGSRLLTSTLASLTAARARPETPPRPLRGIHTFGPTRTHPTGLLCETVPANNTAAPGIAPIRWPIRLGRPAAWHPRGGDRTAASEYAFSTSQSKFSRWGDISSGCLAGLQQKYTTRHGS